MFKCKILHTLIGLPIIIIYNGYYLLILTSFPKIIFDKKEEEKTKSKSFRNLSQMSQKSPLIL